MQCDIIIPVWNQLEYTKECVISLFEFTAFPFRLILIDNASETQTAQYLNNVKKSSPKEVILIRNNENLGFVKAINQGIKVSTAPYICILNNDTKVTTGWLKEMLKVAETRDDIGILNPNSNTLGCKAKKGQALEALARELKSFSGKYYEQAWATGFCMLIKRKVIQEVGLFDEIYGMGTFEDADFCKRAQVLGYLSVYAKAAYVYHHERRSFIKFKQFDKGFERNRQIFFSKWGRQQRILYVITKNSSADIEKTSTDSKNLARQGNIIWIFLKDKACQRIKRHANIYVFSFPKSLFNLISLWHILKRKKKFDRIIVDDENYGMRLKIFRFIHKAKVTKFKTIT